MALLRWGGLALACLSLAPAMLAWGPAFGAVGWFGLLSLAAGALLLARTYLTPAKWLQSRPGPSNTTVIPAKAGIHWRRKQLRLISACQNGSPPSRG